MILGASEIFKRINDSNMITNLPEDFIIEGTSVDLRLDSVFIVYDHSDISLTSEGRITAKYDILNPVEKNGKLLYYIDPDSMYFVNTIERVNIPDGIYVDIKPRSTLFRSGIELDVTGINPGYQGQLTYMMYNRLKVPMVIERKFRICQLIFHEIKGDCNKYNGNWQGGKISSNGELNPNR
jgi:deoxycytidine triphosphate deaminase